MRKLRLVASLIGLVTLLGSCSNPASSVLPPFAGMTGYAYIRANYPSTYMNEVSISSDGEVYTNLGNSLTSYTPVVSDIVSWTSGTMTIHNAVYGTATCSWTTDTWGLVIFLD